MTETVRNDLMPPTLDKQGPFWFLRHIHRNCVRKNKHFALLMCGESGSGKSWNSIAVAYALYNALKLRESLAFSAAQFSGISALYHPKLFPCIIDDAGLSAFSGDALTSQVKLLSKVAQSIRQKNWQIIFNLPNIDLLAKSVRITNHYYAEPLWIDYTNNVNYMKFQRLKMWKDKMIFRNIKVQKKFSNEVTGYTQYEPNKFINFPIPAPSTNLINEYEKLKDEFLSVYRIDTADRIRIANAKELGRSPNKTISAADEMRNKIDQYTTIKGTSDIAKIIEDYGLGINAAQIAYNMAIRPKNKDDVIKGEKKMKEAAKKHIPWTDVDLTKAVVDGLKSLDNEGGKSPKEDL